MNWRSQELSDDRSGLKSNSDFLARASHVLAAKIYADSNAEIMEKVFYIRKILFWSYVFYMTGTGADFLYVGKWRGLPMAMTALL